MDAGDKMSWWQFYVSDTFDFLSQQHPLSFNINTDIQKTTLTSKFSRQQLEIVTNLKSPISLSTNV